MIINRKETGFMEEHVILSEKLEDQLKAVEWARVEQKRICYHKDMFTAARRMRCSRLWGWNDRIRTSRQKSWQGVKGYDKQGRNIE